MYTVPTLKTDNEKINMVFRIAIGDMYSNITMFKDGLLDKEVPVLLAGMGYTTPWTRDAAINVWNGSGLITPEVSRNTLISTIIVDNGKKRAGGQYWDAIIWVVGAERYYRYTGDKEFLPLMIEVTENSLEYFENTEFDAELNLFRGAACYGDGVSAYPDVYSTGPSGIFKFPESRPELSAKCGEGLPMHTLSTNCLYYEAYRIAHKYTGKEEYAVKAENMKNAINKHFWNSKLGRYNYIVDGFGGCDYSEGMGQSFAILFGIADEEQIRSVIANQKISKNGIQCVDSPFPRYSGVEIARHSETVWPQIQAFWADAVAKYDVTKFEHEVIALMKNVLRDGYFSEIYHPETGERCGGFQEWDGNIVEWKSEMRQAWAATGFMRMIFWDILGLRFTEEGMYIKPLKTSLVKKISLHGLHYRGAVVNIDIMGENYGKEAFVPATAEGKVVITL